MPARTRVPHTIPRPRSPRPSSRVRRRRRLLAVAAIALAGATTTALLLSGLADTARVAAATLLSPQGAVGSEDGYIDDFGPISPFDTGHAGVGGLSADLRDAVQAAARDAEADGIDILLTSGWRSARYQQDLLDDAVLEYGSLEEALRWVSTPEESLHVTGDAVDVWGVDPALWLADHGSAYGLCQIYANERWHFELATEPGGECPELLADAGA